MKLVTTVKGPKWISIFLAHGYKNNVEFHNTKKEAQDKIAEFYKLHGTGHQCEGIVGHVREYYKNST